MQIKRLAATFGRLENETLDLEPGLNVIEAPNEAGNPPGPPSCASCSTA